MFLILKASTISWILIVLSLQIRSISYVYDTTAYGNVLCICLGGIFQYSEGQYLCWIFLYTWFIVLEALHNSFASWNMSAMAMSTLRVIQLISRIKWPSGWNNISFPVDVIVVVAVSRIEIAEIKSTVRKYV